LVGRAHAAGYQVTAHAVAGRAIETLLTAFERALESCPRAGNRHRIEHSAIRPPHFVARIARLGVVPCI
jgi:predicted amidohydrolase YtcJ